jgi:hypothetical protein
MNAYKSRNGWQLAPHWVERVGTAACHDLDYRERQGLADPLVVRFVAAVYAAVMTKARAR